MSFLKVFDHFRREPARYLGLAVSGAAVAVGVIKGLDPAVIAGQVAFYIGAAEKLRSVVTPLAALAGPKAAAVVDRVGAVAQQVADELPADTAAVQTDVAAVKRELAAKALSSSTGQ